MKNSGYIGSVNLGSMGSSEPIKFEKMVPSSLLKSYWLEILNWPEWKDKKRNSQETIKITFSCSSKNRG